MDGSTSPTDAVMYRGEKIGGVGYGIGLSFGILSIIATVAVASYFCNRNNANQTRLISTSGTSTFTNAASIRPNARFDVETGLDEETIKSYPKILYPHLQTVKLLNDPIHCSTSTACSICLSDYNDSEFIRVLPDCKHLFHLNCLDPWLRLHPTCPICRMSLFPLPVKEPC